MWLKIRKHTEKGIKEVKSINLDYVVDISINRDHPSLNVIDFFKSPTGIDSISFDKKTERDDLYKKIMSLIGNSDRVEEITTLV
jgi:hypothetical protein